MNHLSKGVVCVKNLHLWSHVGVLDHERLLGQSFLLDFKIWCDLDQAAKEDSLSATADYSIAIIELQRLALNTQCKTLEHFSELILDQLESIYGQIPMHIFLQKCAAPIAGFNGIVGVERCRNEPPI